MGIRSWLRSAADVDSEASLSTRLRRRRFTAFLELSTSFDPPYRILDLGGTPGYWTSVDFRPPPGVTVTVLNTADQESSRPWMTCVRGDATDLSAFADRSFEIVFSNSVIEHVGQRSAQAKMADEISRVGRAFYVQTPYRYFPVEPHFLFPFFAQLPRGLRVWILGHVPLGRPRRRITDRVAAARLVDSVELLDRRTFASVFPDAELSTERVLGLPKSLIAIRRPGHANAPLTGAAE